MVRRKTLFWAVMALAPFMCTAGVKADSIIDNSADAVSPTYGWTAVAQTLTSPGGNFLSYSFWLASSVPEITFSVSAGDIQYGGSALYSVDLVNVGPGEVTVSGINVPTTSGDLYSVLMNLNGFSGDSVLWGDNTYPGGDSLGWGEWGYGSVADSWSKGLGTGFIADFSSAVTPEPSSFLLLISGAMGVFSLRRKLRA